MKKILKGLYCFIIAAAVMGCNKNYLNITPDGRTSLDDVFKDNDQTGAYLNACYGNLQPYGLHYFFWTFLAGLTDDAHDSDAPTESLTATNWYKGSLTPVNNPLDGGGDWNRNYYGMAWQGIRRCNVFLANIDKANVTNAAEKASWKAEAKVLRAYYYLELIKFYGGMPVETTALPITSDFNTLKRGSFNDDVQQIIQDCQAAVAEPNLPWRQTVEGNRGRMTKAIAYAVMSEAALYNASPLWNANNDAAKWQQAATITKDALTQCTANNYALAGNYGNYFITSPDLSTSPADKETIFQIKNSPGITQVQYLNGIPSVAAYKAGCTPSQELVDAYEMANGQQPITGYSDADHLHPVINPQSGYNDANPYLNRDPRFYASVFYNGANYGPINGTAHKIQSFVGGADGIAQNNRQYTHNGYYLKKFVDTTLYQGQGGNASWKRFRLAEIYLNYAEAENEANGPTVAAYNAVNTVRARVHMPALSGLSQSQLRDRIRNERRVEMAFEESRFWDVRRWKILAQSDLVSTGMQWTQSGSNQRIVVDRRTTSADKFLIFPIPSSELASLPAFVQNPGW